jgi:hypothetical protein
VALSQCASAAWAGVGGAPNAGVQAVTIYNGELIAGGIFASIGGVAANRIARWNGVSWQPLGSGLSDAVQSLTVYNGELVVGGLFQTAGGVAASQIARWNGASWQPLGSGIGGPSVPQVRCLAVYNGELIAGGQFQTAGGVATNGIARWNGTSWQSVGDTSNGSVSLFKMAVHNGELIVGGGIPNLNGIARWNGQVWQTVGTGVTGPVALMPNDPGFVYSLAVHNGELVVGGYFRYAGGILVDGLARWNGTSWQAYGSGASGITNPSWGIVDALTVWQGQLVAAGRFSAIDGVPLNRIGRYDGVTWHPFGAGVSLFDPGAHVPALETFHGALIMGGFFSAAGGLALPNLARWSTPAALLGFRQPAGAGGGIHVDHGWRQPGHAYLNLYSLEPCGSGPGTGPYGGLCFSNVATLLAQTQTPLGTPPFHVLATVEGETFGPYPVPPGLSFEAISVDVTGGVVGCISPVVAYTTM